MGGDGQAIAFTPLAARQLFGAEWATEPFLIAAALVGLTLPPVVITWITDGAEGLRRMQRRILTVGVAARWLGGVRPARLQERHGPLRAAAITGALFALGHLSLITEEGSVSAVLVLLALFVAVCIPFRALQGWVYNRTESLVPVALVHAAGNATAAGSVLGAGLLDRLYPGDGAGGLVFPVLGALGVVVIAATRGRLGLSGRGSRRVLEGVQGLA